MSWCQRDSSRNPLSQDEYKFPFLVLIKTLTYWVSFLNFAFGNIILDPINSIQLSRNITSLILKSIPYRYLFS